MARTRNIKPGFFINEELTALEPLARLLFAGLWCWADRDGRLEDRPGRLRNEILPADACDADDLLDQLARHGLILRYAVNGQHLIQVLTFDRHQNPHIKEATSTLPAPEEYQTSPVLVPDKNGTNPAHLSPLVTNLSPLTTSLTATPSEPIEQQDTEVAIHTSSPARKRADVCAPAPDNVSLKDALITALGDLFGHPATDAERRRYARAASQLARGDPPAQPTELRGLKAAWDANHSVRCTPWTLADRLGALRQLVGDRAGPPIGRPTALRRSADNLSAIVPKEQTDDPEPGRPDRAALAGGFSVPGARESDAGAVPRVPTRHPLA